MVINYTKNFLNKLEDIFAETNYMLRYEKGNFKSGYCILRSQQVIVVNKFYTFEGRINCLLDIIRALDFSDASLSERNQKLYAKLIKTELDS